MRPEASHSSVVIGLTRHLSLRQMAVRSEVRRPNQPISQHIIGASVAPSDAVRRSIQIRSCVSSTESGRHDQLHTASAGLAGKVGNAPTGQTCLTVQPSDAPDSENQQEYLTVNS